MENFVFVIENGKLEIYLFLQEIIRNVFLNLWDEFFLIRNIYEQNPLFTRIFIHDSEIAWFKEEGSIIFLYFFVTLTRYK